MDLSVIPRWKNRNTNRTCIVVVHKEKLGTLSNYNDTTTTTTTTTTAQKKQLGLWATQQLCTCIAPFSTFFWRPPHDNDVNPPTATFCANDTQIYLSLNPKATGEPMHLLSRVQLIVHQYYQLDDIKQVDADQWQDWTPCAQPCHRPRLPLESINVGHYVIYMNTSSTAKNRGVWFADEFLSMDKQVKSVDDIYFLAQGNIYRLLTARS